MQCVCRSHGGSCALQVPLHQPLTTEDGTIVERISDTLVLMSNDQDDRVLRLGTSAVSAGVVASVSADTDGSKFSVDDDDSPLLLRKSREPVLFGGEQVVLCVTTPVRAVEAHSSSVEADTGYLLLTNYRLCFVRDVDVAKKSLDQNAVLSAVTETVLQSMYSFPLSYVRWAKTQVIIPFTWDDYEDGPAAAPPTLTSISSSATAAAAGVTPLRRSSGAPAAASQALHAPAAVHGATGAALTSNPLVAQSKISHTMVTVALCDGRLLNLELAHTHLARNAAVAAQLLDRLNRHGADDLFCSAYRPIHPYTFDGWSVFNLFRELRRMFQPAPAILVLDENAPDTSIIGSQAAQVRPTEWRMADVSHLCPTYPKHIAVPRHVSDAQLEAIAQFRTRGRIPALAFLHPQSGAALVRCSQPRAGIKQVRCEDDEFFFREMVSDLSECGSKFGRCVNVELCVSCGVIPAVKQW